MSNILIISSDFTGHGHKSITESLCEQFENYPDTNVHVVDGFALSGNIGIRVGKMYGSITRNAKDLWKIVWELTSKRPRMVCEITELAIKDSFLELVDRVKPDVIVSVHPSFNCPVLNILGKNNIKIPFITLIADLVNISSLWVDKRADYIICPTEESKIKCLKFGVSKSKLKVFGFPIRKKFYEGMINSDISKTYNGKKALECLVMSGGEGSGNMGKIAKLLLKNYNCNVKIVAGRNKLLRLRLKQTFREKYSGRVQVFGFVNNIHELMRESDVVFTRGSPNTMMEAVACNVPLIITGALPGQEADNPGFAQKHSLGVMGNDLVKIKYAMNGLLANNAYTLNKIKRAQRKFANPDTAKDIVDFIINVPITYYT